MAASKEMKVLVGSNGRYCIIAYYLQGTKMEQRYMMKDIPLKEWFPWWSKILREQGIKVTARKY